MIRRRRLTVKVSVVVLTTVGVVVSRTLPAHSASHPHLPSTTTSSPPAGSPAAVTSSKTLHKALVSYADSRSGAVSIAVYDGVGKALTVVHPKVRGRTASIVKVDILETLLHLTGGHLSEEQRETATTMIENSDNDSATDLWNQDGGAPGVLAYNNDVGLKQTKPNVEWGLTTTSAADQVTLVRLLLNKTPLLTNSGRHFQRTLMRNVEADQRWGISAGPPKTAIVGIKNGWLPVTEDNNLWAVNSIGWVHGGGKHYVIAVLTQHQPSEEYGITTIQHLARIVWRHMTVAKS
jgi:Beta-lactamase enzyme family